MRYKKILVIGGGKMGEAILSGWIGSTVAPATEITAGSVTVVEPNAERSRYLQQAHGVACVASVADAPVADVVVLAVKPQVMGDMLAALRSNAAYASEDGAEGADAANFERPLFVSIAAGLATSTIEQNLPSGAALVRVMPNLPLSIGAGASGVCGGACATPDQVQFVADLFGCLGRAVVVRETQMDAVCALSGSGPAYVAAMVEALRDAAIEEGLESQLAEALALQTVLGTAQLLSQEGASVAQTREAVCSPGGTTIAALDAMHDAGFNAVFQAGIRAAVKRSKELSQCC